MMLIMQPHPAQFRLNPCRWKVIQIRVFFKPGIPGLLNYINLNSPAAE